MEEHMDLNTIGDGDDVNELAKSTGVPYRVRISPEFSELLKPNKFLTELGIRYSQRVESILNNLKDNLIPGDVGTGEEMPEPSVVFPLALVKGPFIREELISVKAELTGDGGEAGILLTAVPVEEE
jgi:hypothetical protein